MTSPLATRDCDAPATLNNLGSMLLRQNRIGEALGHLCRAIQHAPNFAEARFNVGIALKELGRLDEAAEQFQLAARLRPDFHEAHNFLGAIWHLQGKLTEALAAYRQSLSLCEDYADAHNNLGATLQVLGRLEEARRSFQRAIELRPDYYDAHGNLAQVLLLEGEFERGWEEYEWRWRGTSTRPTNIVSSAVRWQGEPLAGKTILVTAEQGHGDTFQFVRYLPLLNELGATTYFACPPMLHKFFACSFSQAENNDSDTRRIATMLLDPIPPNFACDFYAPLLSVPRFLRTRLETIPNRVPYLFADRTLIEQWRQRFATFGGRKIGIAWQGNPRYGADRWRSVPLRHFAPLARVSEITLISLQKGAGLGQLADFPHRDAIVTLESLDDETGAFMDTAAVMKNLSLMITSDTSIAHLAGALGIPTWLATSAACDWRWLLDRPNSPWYPSLRLFRQRALGDWQSVIEQMCVALSDRGSL